MIVLFKSLFVFASKSNEHVAGGGCTEPYPPVNYTTLVDGTDQAVLTFYVPRTVFDRISVNWTGVNSKSQHAGTFFSTPGSDSVNVTLISLQGGDLYKMKAVVWSGNLSSDVYLTYFVASKCLISPFFRS
jgi:hypothetical protein